ncbi:hypothetical protein N7499_013258 [Penicillium canescens]|uniref:Uncharacterized protein n=1 Tax=Penicillium canescens TaxID=5083 RepID=A0AAD6I696_PENCN|nr:uncharacterized protein N7446_000090 [Penicillium canescens]KAJ6011769.1 hypothetical protein N7522_002124 [Penicillium canescens]KAJ6030843.1 hypothetical protein N7460_011109 [Penicillium canescens]KAJ6059439.1 hypothetical protein N7444_003078 [Penicillium canescens]KAJ6064578.1 hypothetical protein N7499_013258 [Penicillium canescens]KAJ6077154.1 hypothetical protein N7446_000090 [Penicillium canescens]
MITPSVYESPQAVKHTTVTKYEEFAKDKFLVATSTILKSLTIKLGMMLLGQYDQVWFVLIESEKERVVEIDILTDDSSI